MPQPANLVKAEIREINWDSSQQAQEINSDKTVKVQFNPETLKVNFSNQKSGGDQRGGSAVQFVGAGTTKLALELWFDVTAPLPEGEEDVDDVRRLTQKVAYFITPKPVEGENDKWIPPGVRFIWGTFLFDGVLDSLDENLEYFSEEGKPLRASVSISLSRQEIQFEFGNQQAPGLGSEGAAGTTPMQQANAGDSLQDLAGRAGKASNWKDIASANGIENPRQLAAGTLLDISAGVKVSGGASAGLSAGISGGLSAGASAGLSAGASGELSAGASAGFGASASAGVGGSAEAGTSTGAGAGLSSGSQISSGLSLDVGSDFRLDGQAKAAGSSSGEKG
jgi:hypothetical protein